MTDHRHVLVVEDSRVQAKIISQHIAGCTPFPTIVAHSLAEAEQAMTARRESIFVAILDRNLPDDPDGRIVPLAKSLGIPSVVMTASFSEEVRKLLLEDNVVDYFIKTMAEMEAMERLIERLYKNQFVRALVADDSKLFRARLSGLLTNLNIQVLEAEDGRQALDVLAANDDIRLVITDYNMPNLDGFGLIEEIRAGKPKDKLAIIGVSAEGGHQTVRFLKVGANDFLVKPVEVEEFTCRVHMQLDILDLLQHCRELVAKANA
ncbi:response regulator [Desulfovibrio sp. TomC]|uniref:response regulator n=1 Tax=Desulfovibrio sp. TomC TaxID=1562888 RepID=UPI000573A684|nr:response regulator [Desulfovibrio sp. TomC]KHK01221.1 response regulator receiver domain protein (CheY-like) [Desulfovibrio sp. TomC]